MRTINKKQKDGDPFAIPEMPIHNLCLEENRNLDWVEENIVQLDEVSNKNINSFKENSDAKDFLGLALSQKRLTFFLFFIFCVLSILFAKTAYLQIIKGGYYREAADGNRTRNIPINSERGIIYDKNKRPLVKNVPTFSLYLIPSDFPKDEDKRRAAINQIAEILKIGASEIEASLKDAKPYSYMPVLLRENISYEEAMRLKIESVYLSGVDLKLESRREYLKGDSDEIKSLSHLLGYVGKISKEELETKKNYASTDFIGKTGLELFYEELLRGKNGKKQVEVDVLGKEKRIIAKEEPVQGENIILTLDIDLQKKLEEILSRYLKANHKSKAAAIVLNPQNGEILALVSLPTFDNNFFTRGISADEYNILINDIDKPLFNRAIMGEYPSGSTIKPIIAAAALEEGIITKNTSFNSTGGLRINRWFFPDWKAGGHGWTNVTRAIAESINTFFYIIGGGYNDFKGLGVDRIVKYGKLFGLGEKTGIDFPHESSGLMPTEKWKEEFKGEEWYIGDTYHLAIGQGDILVTPLQIAVATSIFANGGTFYRPHLLNSVEGAVKSSVDDYVVRKNFISNENINIVRVGLRQAVIGGSAQKMLGLPVTSAGKTGTAQWSEKQNPHAWFTAFAPYENPEIVVTVLVEEGGEGSRVALDIVYDFMQWYFTR